MNVFIGRWVIATMVILAVTGLSWADDAQPLPRKELDKRLFDSIYESTKLGVHLYNDLGDESGCIGVYRGTLQTAAPLLDHHPELHKFIMELM
jgi:hypothetical protein